MSDTTAALLQIGALLVLLVVCVPFLARYLAHIYTSPKHLAVERAAYRVLRLDPDADQHWRSYLMSVLGFSLVECPAAVRLRPAPGAPAAVHRHAPDCPATAPGTPRSPSSPTRTGSGTPARPPIGHLFQMAGLTVQNFVSAAVGMAVAAALRPRRSRARSTTAGSATSGPTSCAARVRVLLPISLVAASCS